MKKSAYNKTTGELTKQIANTFIDSRLSLTTAESCTGGLLAAALCAEADTAKFYDIGIKAENAWCAGQYAGEIYRCK